MKYSTGRNVGASVLAAVLLAGTVLTPLAASAQDYHDQQRHRQQTKNTWRNVAIGSGALGVLGLVTHHPVLGVAGAAGAVYADSRYEHDRRSQKMAREHRYYRAHRYHRHRHND